MIHVYDQFDIKSNNSVFHKKKNIYKNMNFILFSKISHGMALENVKIIAFPEHVSKNKK
jgi:hypothetical protein